MSDFSWEKHSAEKRVREMMDENDRDHLFGNIGIIDYHKRDDELKKLLWDIRNI